MFVIIIIIREGLRLHAVASRVALKCMYWDTLVPTSVTSAIVASAWDPVDPAYGLVVLSSAMDSHNIMCV